MSNKNQIMKYLGISAWHEAGYTGKGIKIMSIEPVSSQKEFPSVIAVNGYNTNGTQKKKHADKVMKQMMEISPDATFITCSEKGNTDDWKPLWLDYILRNNVHLFTSSYLSEFYETSERVENYMQECIDNGTTFFIGAGNVNINGKKDIYPEAKSDKYLTIGACEYDDGNVGKAFYSCEGEELDYMAISGWEGETGVSFATNRFSAMCALVQQFFVEKVGRALYRHELIKFIDDNLIDLGKLGFDTKTGKGLFILPAPETIDVYRYIEGNIDYGGFPEVKKMKVCLDAGHGISTAGKRSPDGSLLEYEFNRDVAMKLKAILERHGVEVILTAYDDVDVPLESRCKIANTNKADYFVSIHANADREYWTDVNGWEIYIIGKGGKAEQLAEAIHQYSIPTLGLKDRGIKVANFQVLRDTDMPAVLIEHGFYTNKEECEKLKDTSFRQKCAECDAKGILEHLGIKFDKDINVATKNEADLILTIDKNEYMVNGIKKNSDVAPKIENGRTLVPIYLLRELGLKVEWNEERREVSVWKTSM